MIRAVLLAALLALAGCSGSLICPDDQPPRPSGPHDICAP
jgi:hypothetical protein